MVCSKPPTNGAEVGEDSFALISSSLTSFKICSLGYLGFFFFIGSTFFDVSAILPFFFFSFRTSFGKTVGLKVSLG